LRTSSDFYCLMYSSFCYSQKKIKTKLPHKRFLQITSISDSWSTFYAYYSGQTPLKLKNDAKFNYTDSYGELNKNSSASVITIVLFRFQVLLYCWVGSSPLTLISNRSLPLSIDLNESRFHALVPGAGVVSLSPVDRRRLTPASIATLLQVRFICLFAWFQLICILCD